jgi:hypothetical protein
MIIEANSHLKWWKAMEHEWDSILKNNTWEICDVLKGVNPVSAKWVYKIKVGFDGKPTKLKICLVPHGFQQRARIDYNEIFALIVKWNTIHIVLSTTKSDN